MKTTKVQLVSPEQVITKIRIVGTSPLIMNKFSEKTKIQLEGKHLGKATTDKHEFKNIDEIVDNATHYSSSREWIGFPWNGIKECIVEGGFSLDAKTYKKTQLKGWFHVIPDCMVEGLVRIDYDEKRVRTDRVRVPPRTGNPDIRYRPEFINWSAVLTIQYKPNKISPEQLISIISYAGDVIGLGEWRPQKNGMNGMFQVDQSFVLEYAAQ